MINIEIVEKVKALSDYSVAASEKSMDVLSGWLAPRLESKNVLSISMVSLVKRSGNQAMSLTVC